MKYEEFLLKETPEEGGCLLCESKGRFYLIIKKYDGNKNPMFLVNYRFSWEYEEEWDENDPWKIIYKNQK